MKKKEGKNRIHIQHPLPILHAVPCAVLSVFLLYIHGEFVYIERKKKKEMTDSKAEQSRAQYTYTYTSIYKKKSLKCARK